MSDQIIVKLDSQILNSIELCAVRYEYEHVLNMRSQTKAPALERGGIMHAMLAHYYRAKMNGDYKDRAALVISDCIELGREQAASASFPVTEFEEIDIPTFKAYILHNQYDGWEILSVEQPFSKVLYEDSALMIIYEGIVDARIQDAKGIKKTVDHKTESRKSHPFALSNQFEGYQWAFGDPVVINKIGYQTSLSDAERFRRYEHNLEPIIIQEWIDDTIASVQKAIGWHKTNTFHRNRTSCDKYSGCIYQKVCVAHPDVREFKLQAYFFKDKPWDPFTRDAE
jgi:hypothetical protein